MAIIGGTSFVVGFLTNAVWRRCRKVHNNQFNSTLSSLMSDNGNGDDNIDINSALTGSFREPHKLVLCVRMDLKMQRGKIAAQVGHATLGAYKTCARMRPQSLRVWEENAQPKIAVQISSQVQAMRLQRAAKDLGLPTYMVYDAGRTQVAAVRDYFALFFFFRCYLFLCFYPFASRNLTVLFSLVFICIL